MQQSNVIFGALAIAFIVFITVRGSLSKYFDVLFGNATPSSDGAASMTDKAADAIAGTLGGVSLKNPLSTAGDFLFPKGL